MYYISLYSFKHDPNPCDILEKLKKCDLEGMGRFHLNILHKANLCVLLSEQGTLIVLQPHGRGFVPETSTPKEILCTYCLWSNFSALPFFLGLKHIISPKWLALFARAIKCGLQGPAMSRKY